MSSRAARATWPLAAAIAWALGAVVQAQGVPPTKPDTVRDTSRVPLPAGSDSLKRDIAEPEWPPLMDAGGLITREAILSSGAHSLAELLDRVPGFTGFLGGWMRSPSFGSFFGSPGVRVFHDGREVRSRDPHAGGVLDLGSIPLWGIEEVRVERGASELRVYLRSLTTRSTTPFTRTDVYTGDEDSNQYRGMLARRFSRGEILQLGADELSTTGRRASGGGDQLSVLARVGRAAGQWSVDAFILRVRASRDRQVHSDDETAAVPRFSEKRTDSYLRVGYGTQDGPWWAQVVAATGRSDETTPRSATGSATGSATTDTANRTVRDRQFVAAGGITAGVLRASVTNRTHVRDAGTTSDQTLRLFVNRRSLMLSAFAEHAQSDSTVRLEALGTLALGPSLSVQGAVSRHAAVQGRLSAVDATAMRGEVAVQHGRAAVSGGAMYRSASALVPPTIYDTNFVTVTDPAMTGVFVTARGPIWRAIQLDAMGTRWNRQGLYAPQYTVQSRLFIRTSWLDRFPSGNFGVLASIAHEFRTDAPFPLRDGSVSLAKQSSIFSSIVEIRILRAVVSWQLRNLRRDPYAQVPGLLMPRGLSFYGVRWEFSN
jgi:hypothetical protein